MSSIPSWEEWNEQLTNGQRDYSVYKILSSMNDRLTNLESGIVKKAALILIGSFFGGASTIGAALLARMVFWK